MSACTHCGSPAVTRGLCKKHYMRWYRRDQKEMAERASLGRAACWHCGLREQATIHGADRWWQHEYVPAILTKAR